MDRQRDPGVLRRKRKLRWLLGGLVVIGIISLSAALARLEPALPTVTEGTLWFGTVKRGPMVREVRGSGILVPEEIRWIAASAPGRVERVVLQPGAHVEPGTVVLELTNPDLRQAVRNAELDWETALAQLGNLGATIENTRLQQQSNIVDAESAYQLALTDLEMNAQLAEQGMVAAFALRQKQTAVEQARNRLELVRRQLANSEANEPLQRAPAEAAVNQRRAEVERLGRQLADLRVRSAMTGLLQSVAVEVGQQVGPGVNLARVSDPTRLKAEVRIAETQARDLAIGQHAMVDTRNGVVPGRVARIDPASNGGTVGVDVILEGPLPAGSRPDLGVEATIELERLVNVLFVESLASGQEHGTVWLFRVQPNREAERVSVKLGRRSVQFVEVVQGLAEGDRVILSDMTQYDAVDRLRIN